MERLDDEALPVDVHNVDVVNLSGRPAEDLPSACVNKEVEAAIIAEFSDGKLVRETRYYGQPFPAPEWRAAFVEAD